MAIPAPFQIPEQELPDTSHYVDQSFSATSTDDKQTSRTQAITRAALKGFNFDLFPTLVAENVRPIEEESQGPRDEDIDLARKRAEFLMIPNVTRALISEYSKLGRLDGREERKTLWSRNPVLGAKVLLDLGRTETDVERLAEISAHLAGPEAKETFPLLLEALSKTPGARPEYYQSLLRAIRWMEHPLDQMDEQELSKILDRYARSESVDDREAAYEAAIRLSGEIRVRFLRVCQQREQNEEALSVINEVLDEISDR